MKKRKQRFVAKRKSKKILAKIIFGILFIVFAVLLYGGVLFNLNQYKSFFEEVLAEKISANVSIGSIGLKLIGQDAFKLNNIKVSDPSSKNYYFQAEELHFNLDFQEFFANKRIFFKEISIKNPVLKLRRDEQGKFKFIGQNKTIEPSSQPDSQIETKPKKTMFSFLSLHKWLKLDYSSFHIEKVSLDSGDLEILDENDKDILYLADIKIDFFRLENKDAVNFLMESLVSNNPAEKIRLEGEIFYNESEIKKIPIPEIFKKSVYSINYSFDNIRFNSVSPFFKGNAQYLSKLQDLVFSLCGNISGSLNSDIFLSGRIKPQNLKNNVSLILDHNLQYHAHSKYLMVNNIFALLNDTPVIADGDYYFPSKDGELFLQTDFFEVSKMGAFLKFVKRLNAQGIANINSYINLSNPKFRPKIETTILLNEFTGHFNTLSRPISLNRPCVGTITNEKIIFNDASISFGENPLYLTLTYMMKKPDEKLYLDLKGFSEIGLLDIFRATNKRIQAEKSTENQKSEKSVSGRQITKRNYDNNKRKKNKLPIHVSGLIRNAHLDMANFDSIYVDVLFEENRMLFKDVNINLYQGNFRGNGLITLSSNKPEYSFVGDFDEIDINALLSDTTDFKDIISGTMNSAISFQCEGKTKEVISDSLQGRGVLKIVDGKIINLPLLRKMLSQLSDKNKSRSITIFGNTIGLNIPPIEEFNLAKETPFTTLKCDFEIKPNEYGKNAFHTTELKIESTSMVIWLYGNFDFNKNLYFTGNTMLSKVQTTKVLHKVNELALLFQVKDDLMEIPFKLTGSFSNPEPTPIIKLNGIQNKIEELFRKKLLSPKTSTPDGSASNSDIPVDLDKKGIHVTDKDIEKIEKLQKKIKKYLE